MELNAGLFRENWEDNLAQEGGCQRLKYTRKGQTMRREETHYGGNTISPSVI